MGISLVIGRFFCDNDSNATVWAKHLFGGEGKIELLCGERLVTQLGIKSAPRRETPFLTRLSTGEWCRRSKAASVGGLFRQAD
jgi:hypothetical protein